MAVPWKPVSKIIIMTVFNLPHSNNWTEEPIHVDLGFVRLVSSGIIVAVVD